MKKLLGIIVALVVLGLIVVFGADLLVPSKPELADAKQAPTEQQIEHGRYLARMGDCAACHTAPEGKPFAGGLPFATEMGTMYSTNITPDPEHGIGGYSLQEFARAVREGRLKDGTHLYPAMPYPSYAKISDDDIRDMYAYFMKGVAPDSTANRDAQMKFPFGIRKFMGVWNLAFYDAAGFDTNSVGDDKLARGAYLTEGLGHCGACHTPRGFGQQEQGLSGKDAAFLSGASVEGWYAPSLRAATGGGLGRWTAEELADLLRSGRSVHSGVTGPMKDVIAQSMQYATEDDALSMARYMKSLKPAGDNGNDKFSASDETANELRNGKIKTLGARLYVDNCAACHRSSGKGEPRTFPSLAGNGLVLADDPSGLVHVILAGATMPSTISAPSDLGMPHFAQRLNDDETAELATFLRSAWGNKAGKVSAEQVTAVRKKLPEALRTPVAIQQQ